MANRRGSYLGLLSLPILLLAGWLTTAEAACTGATPTWTCPVETNMLSLKALIAGTQTGLQEGDIVNIPAGSATLANRIVIANKSFSLIGAGIGNTILDFQDTASGYCAISWTTHNTGGTPAGIARVSGFTLKSTANCSSGSSQSGAVNFLGTSTSVRYDHNWCHFPQTQCLHFQGSVQGVADHNTFTLTTGAGGRHMVTTSHTNWTAGTDGYGDTSWGAASSWGTAANVYFEDNTFDNQMLNADDGLYSTDDQYGSRTVYRFNEFHNTTFQTHGTETGGRYRSARETENYRNHWTWNRTASWGNAGASRGGSMRWFDNVLNVTSGPGITSAMFSITTYRFNVNPLDHNSISFWGGCGQRTTITDITRSGTTATVTTNSEHFVPSTAGSGAYIRITGANESNFNRTFVYGYRVGPSTNAPPYTFTYQVDNSGATSATGTPVLTSPFDGNTDTTGYRCVDQVGAGQSTLYNGGYPNVLPLIAANNALDPGYIFHNMKDGVLSSTLVGAPPHAMVENRDFYNENSAFDGVTNHGIGRGSRASRPAACTAGDGWWATNDATNWNTSTTETFSARISGLSAGADGALDICDTTGNPTGHWTDTTNATCTGLNCYVPYTYPHPLIAATDIFTPPAITTFGQTAIGTLTWNSTPASILFNKFTAPNQVGTITKISVYAKDGSGGSFAMGGALYADNAGVPGTKLAEDSGNATVSGNTFTWYDIPITYQFSANQVLWLAFWGNSTNLYYTYESAGGTLSYNSVPTFETWPAPNTVSNPSTRLLSVYATFNSSASPQPNDMANLAAGATTTTTQVLTWDALAGGTAPRTGSIELCAGFNCQNFASYATGLTTPGTLTGLTHTTLYRARGFAVDALQAVSLNKSAIVEFTTTTPTGSTPPAQPTGVRIAGASTATAIALLWDANSDADLAGYNVYQSVNDTFNRTIMATNTPASAAAAHSPVTRYMATAVPGATTYWFVSAFDTDGNESVISVAVSQTLAAGTVRTATARAARQ